MDIEGKGCLKAQVKINPKVTTVLEYGMGFKKIGWMLEKSWHDKGHSKHTNYNTEATKNQYICSIKIRAENYQTNKSY